MSGNGEHALRWTGRVVSAEDLRRRLNGHRELLVAPATVITPLAAEHLRDLGISVTRQAEPKPEANTRWSYAQERPEPMVASVLQALARDGMRLVSLQPAAGQDSCAWARAVAESVARGECEGSVVFCSDAGLACCVANKLKGVRAAAVFSAQQAARALLSLGANFLAVEMPGRTFFELRQIVRGLAKPPSCPPLVACVLQELESHAHR